MVELTALLSENTQEITQVVDYRRRWGKRNSVFLIVNKQRTETPLGITKDIPTKGQNQNLKMTREALGNMRRTFPATSPELRLIQEAGQEKNWRAENREG